MSGIEIDQSLVAAMYLTASSSGECPSWRSDGARCYEQWTDGPRAWCALCLLQKGGERIATLTATDAENERLRTLEAQLEQERALFNALEAKYQQLESDGQALKAQGRALADTVNGDLQLERRETLKLLMRFQWVKHAETIAPTGMCCPDCLGWMPPIWRYPIGGEGHRSNCQIAAAINWLAMHVIDGAE